MSPPSFLVYNQYMQVRILLCFAVSILVIGCSAPLTPSPAVTVTTMPPILTPGSPSLVATPNSAATSSSAPTPGQGSLRSALIALDGEVRAAQTAASFSESRLHMEAALNMLVGLWGRWYGDSDGDGMTTDPLQGAGILPGERVPGPPPDVGRPLSPVGLALIAYSNTNDSDKQVIAGLFDDIGLWQSTPRKGYDTIESAIKSANTPNSVLKLSGPLPRIVAYLRLALTKANSATDAASYLQHVAADSSAAMSAASKLQ